MELQTIFEYNEIYNSPTDNKGFVRDRCYNVEITNYSSFEVQLVDKYTGEIRIPANEKIEFKAHPYAPSNISYKVRFSNVAPTTDFITIKTSCVYGNITKC